MSIPDTVYSYFDSLYGSEYALIELNRPFVSLRREAREFFGEDFKISVSQATEIMEELEKWELRKVRYEPTEERYTGIPGNDFMTLIAMFIEL